MNMIELVILWLSARENLARIMNQATKSNDLLSLAETAIDISSKCYEKRINTLGLAGILDIFSLEALSSQHSFVVALIGNHQSETPVVWKSRRKLHLFVVTASSSVQLRETLRQIKSSPWWNHMATFLILDWQSTERMSEDTCSTAYDYMWTAWEMNLLNVAYLCVHRTRGRLIYTYNPYTHHAPEPWHLEDTYKGKNNHPWTMFTREYDIDDKICDNLEFDKTNDLGGYQISATVKHLPPSMLVDSNKTGIDSVTGYLGDIAKTIIDAFNVTVHLNVHDMQRPGFFDGNNNDIAMDIGNGFSDILLFPRFHVGVLNHTVSYAFDEVGFIIVTQHKGQQSQLYKLITVFDSASRMSLCLVVLTVVVFFKFCLQQSFGSAVLNALRIIGNSSLTRLPSNQGPRIFLAGVFFLVVTIVGIYHGRLASLLTKSKPLRNMETLEDLAENGYKIHANKVYADMFTTPAFKNRFIGHDDHLCLGSVVRNSLTACISPRVFVFAEAVHLKLHISRDIIHKSAVVYVIREDWPLEERLNKILGAMNEAHIVAQKTNANWKKSYEIAKFNDFMVKNQKCKVITLNELTFAFVFLCIGLTFATASFIVEIAAFSLLPKIKNVLGIGIRTRDGFK